MLNESPWKGTNGLSDNLTIGGNKSGCQGGGHFIGFSPPEPLSSLAPGLTQLNPVAADVAGPEQWTFADASNKSWFDLPLSSQFDFDISGALLTEAMLPTGFKDGDGIPFTAFEVLVGDQSLGMFAGGNTINFATLTGNAVGGFTVRGIGAATPPTGFENFPIRLSFETTPASFTATPASTPGGDFDGDGVVGPEDLAAWSDSFGVDDGDDANGDGVTDGADFLIWQTAFAPPEVVAVPEPTSVLLLAGLTFVCAFNRYRS